MHFSTITLALGLLAAAPIGANPVPYQDLAARTDSLANEARYVVPENLVARHRTYYSRLSSVL